MTEEKIAGNWTKAHELFKVALAAEEAFASTMRASFGTSACEARYRPWGKKWRWTAEHHRLADAKQRADEEYLAECSEARDRDGW